MKIEVWSDIVCPFCYIGKRRLEHALEAFPEQDKIEIQWKSFQLSPHVKTDPSINIHQYLAKHKGISVSEAERLNDYVTQMAADVGLTYRFDKAIPANTFNAHRALHFAKAHGKQGEIKEQLMHAYFLDGKNIDDISTLTTLAAEAGLDPVKLSEVLNGTTYSEEVNADISEAHSLGVRGVPFFVFDRKYAVSGAQAADVFSQVLEKSFSESASA